MQRHTRTRSDAAAPRPFAYDLAANTASRVSPLTFQSAHVKTQSSLSSSDGLLMCQSSLCWMRRIKAKLNHCVCNAHISRSEWTFWRHFYWRCIIKTRWWIQDSSPFISSELLNCYIGQKSDIWNLLLCYGGQSIFWGLFWPSLFVFFFLFQKIKVYDSKNDNWKICYKTCFRPEASWTVSQAFILDCGHGKNSFWCRVGFFLQYHGWPQGKNCRACKTVVASNIKVHLSCRTFMVLD